MKMFGRRSLIPRYKPRFRLFSGKTEIPTTKESQSVAIGAISKQDAKMYLQFTCSHAHCVQTQESERVVKKYISKLSYDEGVVLVRCKCDKLHLIADRLGWFQDGGVDIEAIAKERGLNIESEASEETKRFLLEHPPAQK